MIKASTTHIEETYLLLTELSNREHYAAAALRESWLVDAFLKGELSASEASALGGVSDSKFRAWLEKRNLSCLLDTPRDKTPHDSTDRPEISVVLPIFNEEENLPELYRRLVKVLGESSYEILFVNDGSSDRSLDLICELREINPKVKLINLSRNFGHQAAITAGIDHSLGRAVVLLDADLQDPPELIAEMLDKWRSGNEVVYAVRQKRKDGIIKRSAYFWFYRLLKMLSNIDIPLDSGDFCLMDRAVVEKLKALPERNRFLRGLRSWVGYKQVALPYERHARHAGTPKYTFRKLVKLALDGIVSFSSFPLRVAAYIGFLTCLSGICYLIFAVIAHFVNNRVPVGWTSTVALILLVGGSQLLLLGVLGEYIARIYDESKQRPPYIVKSFLK
jgi:dolichol-phosphate mannosyltransferase